MGDTLEKLKPRVQQERDVYTLTSQLWDLRRANWIVLDPAHPKAYGAGPPVKFKIPDVKMFCERCDRTEAYNLVSADDFLGWGNPANNRRSASLVILKSPTHWPEKSAAISASCPAIRRGVSCSAPSFAKTATSAAW
jgi:hypothetical protein